MTRSKALDAEANEWLRGVVRELLKDKTQTELAEAMGIRQSYLSDFLSRKRGAGVTFLRGLVRVKPELAARLLAMKNSGRPISLPPRIVVSEQVETVARRILRRRGWQDPEISAGKARAELTTQADADDPIAVADAWELPLRGPEPRRALRSQSR